MSAAMRTLQRALIRLLKGCLTAWEDYLREIENTPGD